MRSTSICSVCGEITQRPKIIFDPNGSSVYCRRCVPPAHARGNPDVAKNPLENFTLEHFPRENGKKVVVNSLKELRDAEKRHGAVLAALSDDDISAPPQNESWAGDVTHNYTKKFERDPSAYKKPDASKGVSTGIARDAGGTIAHLPNPV